MAKSENAGNRKRGRPKKAKVADVDDLPQDMDVLKLDPEAEARLEAQTKEEHQKLDKLIGQATRIPRRRIVRSSKELAKQRKKNQTVKKLAEASEGNSANSRVDSLISSIALAAKKEIGGANVIVSRDLENCFICIPVPMAFEFLIGQDAYPLGVVTTIVGPPGVSKTTFLHEIGAWFRDAGGGGVYIENEGKMSPDLHLSVLGYDQDSIIVHRTTTQDDWQSSMTYWAKKFRSELMGTKAAPGPGRTIPLYFALDSFMGTAAKESTEKILKEGMANRAFPVEALKNAKYLRSLPQVVLKDWPFNVFVVNHLVESKDEMGFNQRNLSGGKFLQFTESFQFEFKRLKRINLASMQGQVIRIKAFKNSQAPDGNSIETRVLWDYERDPETGMVRQVTKWDWNWALVNHLLKARAVAGCKLQDVIHLDAPRVSDAANCVWSKTLGVSKNSPIPWSEMGALIVQDGNLVNQIREALGVKSRAVFRNDLDYAEQVAEQINLTQSNL